MLGYWMLAVQKLSTLKNQNPKVGSILVVMVAEDLPGVSFIGLNCKLFFCIFNPISAIIPTIIICSIKELGAGQPLF